MQCRFLRYGPKLFPLRVDGIIDPDQPLGKPTDAVPMRKLPARNHGFLAGSCEPLKASTGSLQD